MATFVEFTSLTGTSVYINPDKVSQVAPIPAGFLPTGVAAGCYVDEARSTDGPGPRRAVQGDITTVVAALVAGSSGSGGGGSLAGMALVDRSGGTLVAATGVFVGGSCVENSPGSVSVSTVLPITAGSLPLFTATDDGARVTLDGPVAGFGFSVRIVDNAGTPTTFGFIVALFAPPA